MLLSCAESKRDRMNGNKLSSVTNKNLIYGCKDDGFSYYDCRFNENEVYINNSYEVELDVKYTFSNCGAADFSLGIKDQTGKYKKFLRTSKGEIKNMPIIGYSPFKTYNDSPNLFEDAFVWKECQLSIVSVVAKPSLRTIGSWNDNKNNLEEKLILAENSKSANQALVTLLPAYEVLNTVISNLASDISGNQSLRNRVCELTSCDSPYIEAETVFGALHANIDANQKNVLSKFQFFIYSLPDINICEHDRSNEECSELIISSALTEEDISILEDITSSLPSAQNAELKYRDAVKNIIQLQNDLDKLKAVSKDYIDWNN